MELGLTVLDLLGGEALGLVVRPELGSSWEAGGSYGAGWFIVGSKLVVLTVGVFSVCVCVCVCVCE